MPITYTLEYVGFSTAGLADSSDPAQGAPFEKKRIFSHGYSGLDKDLRLGNTAALGRGQKARHTVSRGYRSKGSPPTGIVVG